MNDRTTPLTENHSHFYASSVADWVTTNETRDLRELLKMMDKFGYPYNLFLVPVKHTDNYEIKMYQPMVIGTQWLGFFEIKKGKK
jgi:hypothetical protein